MNKLFSESNSSYRTVYPHDHDAVMLLFSIEVHISTENRWDLYMIINDQWLKILEYLLSTSISIILMYLHFT